MEQIKGFHDLLRQKSSSVLIAKVKFNLNDLPNNGIHVSGFCGKDEGIVELNVVFLANTVFSYG
jgi:hypothetical protein